MDPEPSEEAVQSTSAAPQESGGIDSPSSKEEENEASEECSVCRNGMTDITTLSDCVHEFCYDCLIQWLTRGSSPFCPMCKAPVRFIKRKGTDTEIPLEQIQMQKEPEPTASEDLITEKRIVSKKIRDCRRLMNRIDEIIGSTSRLESSRRQTRTTELNTMKQLCVAQLNSLQILRDDIDRGALKAFIVSQPAFRRLIYERAVMVVGTSSEERRLSKEEFLANIEHYRSVLNAFLTVELKSLPLATQPSVNSQNRWYFQTVHDVLQGKDNEFVNRIFSLISERGVNELKVRDVLEAMNGLITIRIATIFLGEIRSLVNSKKTFMEWCGTVQYRNNSDIVGGNVATVSEVVTVDDSVEDDEPVYGDNRRREEEQQRRFPFFNPHPLLHGQSPHFNRFLPNVSLSSLFDQNAPLRIRRNPDAFRMSHVPSFQPIPASGISWSDLTRTTDKPTSMRNFPSTSRNVPVVDLEDDAEDNEIDVRSSSSSGSDDNNGIQIVDKDDTIVLSDSPAIRIPAERKRKNDSRFGDLYKRSKYEELPDGLVEDVKKLISKYNMPMVQAMNIMVNAAQEAIKQNAATEPVNLLARNRNEPSTSSNLQPNDALQVAGSLDLARTGMGPWTKNAPEKRDWRL